ncbi:MAG: type II secretion system protein [Fibrobacter sp.]|nr:type II secretion system protein [Fibrobacter sp.]
MKFLRQSGFTLLEMLVAMTVAAILTGVSLNVCAMIHRGAFETSLRYGLFVSEKVKELRCLTSFVRGVMQGTACNSMQSDGRHMDVRWRF